MDGRQKLRVLAARAVSTILKPKLSTEGESKLSESVLNSEFIGKTARYEIAIATEMIHIHRRTESTDEGIHIR